MSKNELLTSTGYISSYSNKVKNTDFGGSTYGLIETDSAFLKNIKTISDVVDAKLTSAVKNGQEVTLIMSSNQKAVLGIKLANVLYATDVKDGNLATILGALSLFALAYMISFVGMAIFATFFMSDIGFGDFFYLTFSIGTAMAFITAIALNGHSGEGYRKQLEVYAAKTDLELVFVG